MNLSRGVVIYAHNSTVDYVKLARECARRVHAYLGVPVCLISSEEIDPDNDFDVTRLVQKPEDGNTRTLGANMPIEQFYNQDRTSAFELSPFDETIILDADYLVCSNMLGLLWGSASPLRIPSRAVNLSLESIDQPLSYKNIMQLWATVVYFKRSIFTERFFRMLTVIRNNWDFFYARYQLESPLYRNDYAVAIALHIMHGFTRPIEAFDTPFRLVTACVQDTVVALRGNAVAIDHSHKHERVTVALQGVDVHVINKKPLLELIT